MDIILQNWKLILSLLNLPIILYTYIPYIKDILKGNSKPHLYTWLVWSVTVFIAALGIVHGGSLWSSLFVWTGFICVIIITILSIRYGTNDIRKSDKYSLFMAVVAMCAWAIFNNPFISVLLVTLIDFVGYFPTIRKTINDPSSELPIFWLLSSLLSWVGIISATEYNFYTVFYLSMTGICNMIVFLIVTRFVKINHFVK